MTPEQTQEHTEHSLPWKCEVRHEMDRADHWHIKDRLGRFLFARADKSEAEFIVTACNSYYEREREIKRLRKCLTDIAAYAHIWSADEIEEVAERELSRLDD